jgi:hypothetical protein
MAICLLKDVQYQVPDFGGVAFFAESFIGGKVSCDIQRQ